MGKLLVDTNVPLAHRLGPFRGVPTSPSNRHADEGVPHHHYRSVVEHSDDAVISKTIDGIITSWNSGAEAIFGYSAQEMLGQPMHLLYPPENPDDEEWILQKIGASGQIDHLETERLTKQGRRICVSVTISPILSRTGKVIGVSQIARDISERRLLEDEARLHADIIQSTGDAVVGECVDGFITTWNRGAQRLYGYSAKEMVGVPMARLLPPEHQHDAIHVLARVRSGEEVAPLDTVRVRKDGTTLPVSVRVSAIYNRAGQIIGASEIARDISAQKDVEAHLRLTASVFSHTSEGILILKRNGEILDVNDAFSTISGFTKEEVVGRHPNMFWSTLQSPEAFKSMQIALLRTGEWRGELMSRRKDGNAYSVMVTVSKVRASSGPVQNYVALFSDITQLRLQQQKLEHWAHFDALTGLPNRWLLSDRLKQAVAMSKRHNQILGVIYMDLDGFKTINDHHGHVVGDQLLIAVSQRMKNMVREVDTLARMGGDEFVAVLVDIKDASECLQLVQRILDACSEPVRVGELDLSVTASVGVTMFPPDTPEPDLLIRHADQAMYEAKESGKNRYWVFDAARDAVNRTRTAQQEEFARAIDNQELLLHYQPKVNMCTGEVMGCEALVRWQHPQRGLLGPYAFLPFIEMHPLSEALGFWVMEEAIKQMGTWAREGLHIGVSVNIGATELQQAHFTERLFQLLDAYREVDPTYLELEILETSALKNLDAVLSILQGCQAKGVRFAIDDFGTGYSSLTYLRRLPVDLLKIDQSFVRGMLDDQNDLAIVTGVIGLAAAFQRKVIAEGVESVEHGVKLIELGCQLAQGYAIARPMPAAEVQQWVSEWQTFPAWRCTA